jgi:hypothetical protein
MWRIFQDCCPLKVFFPLNITVWPAHGFEFDTPGFEHQKRIEFYSLQLVFLERRASEPKDSSRSTFFNYFEKSQRDY